MTKKKTAKKLPPKIDINMQWKRVGFGVFLRSDGKTVTLDYDGEPSIWEALGLVEAARAILRMQVLQGTTPKPPTEGTKP